MKRFIFGRVQVFQPRIFQSTEVSRNNRSIETTDDATTDTPRKSKRSQTPMIKRLLHTRNVSRTKITGKIRETYAMVVVGDGNGSAGYGEGRSSDFGWAVQKAEEQAMKNMVYLERLDNRTIFSDTEHRLVNTNVKLWTATAG